MKQHFRGTLAPCAGLVLLLASAVQAQPAIAVRSLQTQRVGDQTYFYVSFTAPKDYDQPNLRERWRWWETTRADMNRLPRLVAQDSKTEATYLWANFSFVGEQTTRVELEFYGRVASVGEAKLLLLYPTVPTANGKEDEKKLSKLAKLLQQHSSWGEEAVTLDFKKAQQVPQPLQANMRNQNALPVADDLEGRWAVAQAGYFAVLEQLTPEFSYYSFARDMSSRKYQVPVQQIRDRFGGAIDPDLIQRRTFELLTGAEAIAETMARRRLRQPGQFRDNGPRDVDISSVRGIDIAEHDWVKMMGGKKPAPEPLAKMVPHDNYYIHFKTMAKFLDFSDLMDQWGSSLTRAMSVTGRDHRVKERLQHQLCIRNTGLARIFGPAIIKSLAFTGSDPYVKEGSDFTIIFHAGNKKVLVAALDGFIAETKKQYGARLSETSTEYLGNTVESYTTKHREVSLHRAINGDHIIYSNSLLGLQRVLDTQKGKRKALSDALDFQYMRTVFRVDDAEEDGFVFLSDAFLRNLVGPVTRIKEQRRLEALTSMYMATNGALYAAWDSGRLPAQHNDLLTRGGLKAEELFTPDGGGVSWDADNKVAVSATYNTLHFATPLIELPIDKITRQEEQGYNNFRAQYLGLWRQFFDPVGIRLGISEKKVGVEVYILPLVQNSQYNELRRLTGDGTLKLDLSKFGPNTLMQFFSHISPNARERQELARGLGFLSRDIPGVNWLGDWVTVRADDSDVYGKLVEKMIQRELGPRERRDWADEARLAFQMPLTVGAEIRNPLVFAGVLAALKKALTDVLPNAIDWEPMNPPYKGNTLVKISARPEGIIGREINADAQQPFTPAVYYTLIDGGFYLSLQEAPLKQLIDRAEERRKNKDAKPEIVEVNKSIYLAPGAISKAKPFMQQYLEWETHQVALNTSAMLYPLYRAGLVSADTGTDKLQATALQLYGYMPFSPDASLYSFDPKTHDVSNARHGSLRRPQLHPALEERSPINAVLEAFRTIRVDLRFREDGVHSVIEFERKK